MDGGTDAGMRRTVLAGAVALVVAGPSWTFGASPAPEVTPGSTVPATQPLPVPRADHTASVLSDGRVLVIGGYGAPDPDGGYRTDGSALLWDPATGTFSDAGQMVEARSGHAAVSLPDGRVLVAGGGSASVEIWDPATAAFTVVATLRDPAWATTAVLLHDGRVLILPEGARRETSIWDPGTGDLVDGPLRWLEREGSTVTVLPSGRVLIAGGADVGDGAVEGWDPGDAGFRPGKRLLEDRWDHTATLLPDGGLLIAGGMRTEGRELVVREIIPEEAELRDPVTREFVVAGIVDHPRTDHTATLLLDGTVAVIGGYDEGPDGDGVLSSVERWDPVARSFTEADPLERGRARHTASLLHDGRVVVIGGIRERGWREVPIASVEVWTPPAPDGPVMSPAPGEP